MANSDLLDDLMAVERRRSDALCRRDIAHLEACLDAGYLYVHGSGQLDGRAEYIASQTARAAEFTSFVYTGEQCVDHGNWAALTGVVTMNYTLDDAPHSRRYRFTSSWHRVDDSWMLCHWQNTAIA